MVPSCSVAALKKKEKKNPAQRFSIYMEKEL